MKKLVKGFCLMGVVALLATSCTKKEDKAMVYRGYSYDAQFETEAANFDAPTRAYIDNTYRMMFEANDQVMLFNIDNTTAANSEMALYQVVADGYQPEFTPYQAGVEISDEMKDAKYAFYPGNNVVKDMAVLANENRCVFKLLPTQVYRELSGTPVIPQEALYMAAKIDNANETNFAFRNICGVLVMKFYSPTAKTITSIKVTDHALHLTGDVTLKVNEVDPALMMDLFRNYPGNESAINDYKDQVGYSVDHYGYDMTLDCGTGVTLGTTAADADTFYFVLRPLALSNGFDMEITFSDSTTKTLTVNKDNTIKPNTLRVFPALSVD